MHTIAPYLLRCFDATTKSEENPNSYSKLDSIRGRDLYEIVKSFVSSGNPDELRVVEDEKRVYFFSDVSFSDDRREIFGFMNSGFYGVGTNIVDITSGRTVYRKNVNNADMIRHYFHFFIPRGCDEAICVLSAFRGDGVKTIFFKQFDIYFKEIIPLYVSATPLSYEKALQEWQAAVAKEIRVTRFNAVPNIEDVEINGGHIESMLVMKPKKRRMNFGRFSKFFEEGTEQANLVATLSEMGSQINTVVQLGKRKHTFKVGPVNDNVVCQIDFPDDMQLDDGMPLIANVSVWASGIIAELCRNMYKGVEDIYCELQS